MGSWCSAFRRDETKEECHKVDQEKEVFTTVENGEQSALLQTRSYLQEEGGAVTEITGEKTLRRQEEENSDTASETLDCSEKNSTLLHESTLAEVNTSR